MQICRENFFFIGGYHLLTTKTWKIFIILTQFVEFFKFFQGIFFLLQKISFWSSEKKNKFWSFLTFRGGGSGGLDQGLENSKLFFFEWTLPLLWKSFFRYCGHTYSIISKISCVPCTLFLAPVSDGIQNVAKRMDQIVNVGCMYSIIINTTAQWQRFSDQSQMTKKAYF